MERYEFIQGNSAKFWEVDVVGTTLSIRWGRIGTKGQSTTKTLESAEAADKERINLTAEKTRKGYRLLEEATSTKDSPRFSKRADGQIEVVASGPRVLFRLVEYTVDQERETGPEATIGHDRVSAGLYFQLSAETLGFNAGDWIRLAEMYVHDSYDGAQTLVLESSGLFAEGYGAISETLQWSEGWRALLQGIAPLTKHPDAIRLLAADEYQPSELGPQVLHDSAHLDPPNEGLPEKISRGLQLMTDGHQGGEHYSYIRGGDGARAPKIAEGLRVMNSAEEADPSSGASAALGHWFMDRDFFEEAVKAYGRALKKDRSGDGFLLRYVGALIHSYQEAKAVPLLTKLLKQNPQDAHLYFLRARCHHRKPVDDKSLAVADCKKALALKPHDPRYWILMGEIHRKDWSESLSDFDCALREGASAVEICILRSDVLTSGVISNTVSGEDPVVQKAVSELYQHRDHGALSDGQCFEVLHKIATWHRILRDDREASAAAEVAEFRRQSRWDPDEERRQSVKRLLQP